MNHYNYITTLIIDEMKEAILYFHSKLKKEKEKQLAYILENVFNIYRPYGLKGEVPPQNVDV